MQDEEFTPGKVDRGEALLWLHDHIGQYMTATVWLDLGHAERMIVMATSGELRHHRSEFHDPDAEYMHNAAAAEFFAGCYRIGRTRIMLHPQIEELALTEGSLDVELADRVTLRIADVSLDEPPDLP